MRYRVRHEGELSDFIDSSIGILIGDTLSPEFWIIFFGDFDIPVTDDDIRLAGIAISHLEQADDLLLLALSPRGLQYKMDLFYAYCGNNFLIINAIKSLIGYHGPAPVYLPKFHFNGEDVEIVDVYTYVGMAFRSGPFNAFSSVLQDLFVNKTKKASKVAHAVLHIESMIGALPVQEGKILYMGCVDPHLIYGCEVAIDASKAHMDQVIGVQLAFFRRLLGLSKTSIRVAIYTETGIIPVQFRWLNLALRALAYFLSQPADTFIRAALNESIALESAGKRSWFRGLKTVINSLCPDYKLPNELIRVSRSSYLLQLRKEPQENGNLKYHISCMRHYLSEIQNPRHRKALTRLITGDHSLAVVRLTWTDNHRLQVPYEHRLCRFCTKEVETPEHALLQCPYQPLVESRTMDQPAYVAYLASCHASYATLAKWVFEILKIYEGTPLLIPREYLRDSRCTS
ncbi:hypothetical protein BT96DRAFT_1078628 [Gymnopus androsaceus JB14]|uniref:Reverse transcriptase domain-containing protein n=1 Tax=Gymnopus androsaceus JB14 TaxID=1447944 RepID=A0A6A4I4J5_9AGAR|nr:hypothetical protein BT96DRAFT_1078628 [Gymnopus androsaceus JB14]